jgi:hypothetical protein
VVPYIVHGYRMFVPVRVGNLSGYAQVDTGASCSMIRNSFASGFPTVTGGQFRGALGTAEAKRCRLPVVSLLGEDFSDLVVYIQPDSAGDFGSLPFQVILTAGVDILYHKPLYLDCARQMIGFLDPASSRREEGSQEISLSLASGFAFFKLEMGPHSLNALFDTGAGYSVLHARLLELLRDQLIEQEPEEVTDPAGGNAIIPVYKHPCLAIDGQPIGEGRFLVIDLEPVERVLGTQLDFVFGFNTITGHDWVVDRPRQRLLRLPGSRG